MKCSTHGLVFSLLTIFMSISLPSQAYETSNIQLLYSNQFDGDAAVYDTQDGHKTTLTLEHFRTWDYGDFFAFADIMYGTKLNGDTSEVYIEISPRLSLSKISGKTLQTPWASDFFIASQLNLGDGYDAWLLGLGVDLQVPKFNYFSLNLYQKRDNFKNQLTQITASYQTQSFGPFHFEGFVDLTDQDMHTHNQLLYKITNNKNPIYAGVELINYRYEYQGSNSSTDALQIMAKYQF